METIHERIHNRRIELGLSVIDVARALGVSRATVYRYENKGIEKLPFDIIKPLARVLHTTPEYIMGWGVEVTTSCEPATSDDLLQAILDTCKPMSNTQKSEVLTFANYIKERK